jgi:hypothetical protein
MLKMVKLFFGGGSTIAYLLLGSAVLGVYLEYRHTKKQNAKLEIQVEQQQAAIEGKDLTIRTQAQTQQRRANQRGLSNEANAQINDTVDGDGCLSSESTRAYLGWLHNNPDPASTYDDKADVPVRQ